MVTHGKNNAIGATNLATRRGRGKASGNIEDSELLREVAWQSEQHPLAFICGPTQLVEDAASSLLPLGYDPTRVKTERFGPTGGS